MALELQAPALSLYVHLPWCLAKCPYCDFNSYAATEFPAEAYVDALIADLERELPRIWGRPVHSIFLGGGTPSLFPPESIARLLSELRARLRLVPGLEVSLEANPGASESARFHALRAAGVNRLSLGVQSFDDGFLARLGRVHDGRAAHAALSAIQEAGFAHWNLDLIFALPGQDLQAALADLEQALAYAPPHLSLYQLTLEAGTPFARQAPAGLPGEDLAADMELALRERLEQAGLARYEISAHARPGQECWHNRNYWRFGDYVGIGAGAHGKITLPGEGIWRTRKPARPESYMEDALSSARTIGSGHWVPPAERPFEFMLNALRLLEGFTCSQFEASTGLPCLEIEPQLRRAQKEGLLIHEGGRWRPTRFGLDWHNELCGRFLPRSSQSPARRAHEPD